MVTPRSFFGEPAEFQMNFAGGISDVVVGMDRSRSPASLAPRSPRARSTRRSPRSSPRPSRSDPRRGHPAIPLSRAECPWVTDAPLRRRGHGPSFRSTRGVPCRVHHGPSRSSSASQG
jgi:hypothetical protein